MYNVESGNEEKYNVQLMKLNKSFSKKAISQIEVITDYQLLICLTGEFQLMKLNLFFFNNTNFRQHNSSS